MSDAEEDRQRAIDAMRHTAPVAEAWRYNLLELMVDAHHLFMVGEGNIAQHGAAPTGEVLALTEAALGRIRRRSEALVAHAVHARNLVRLDLGAGASEE